MERRKASDFPPEVMELFDGYVHGRLSRREFLERAARYAAGGITAAGFLEMLSPNFAWAQQVKPGDARIRAERIDFDSPRGSGKMRGYLARPAAAGRAPGVVVFHENRGLSPYIEDVARRLAVEGYVALAPDALAPVGGYPGDEDRGRELFAKLDRAKAAEDLLAGYEALAARPDAGPRIGAVGFCFGGGMVNLLATRAPALAAGVAYYGPPPPDLADVAKIKAPLLVQLAEIDNWVNSRWPPFREALEASNVRYRMHLYPGAHHGFHNDTTPRYDEAAAKLSWSRTLAFFAEHLK